MGKRTIPNAFCARNATKAYLERSSTSLKKRKFVKSAIRQLKDLVLILPILKIFKKNITVQILWAGHTQAAMKRFPKRTFRVGSVDTI